MDGFYINLERSMTRRASIEAQLRALGLTNVRRWAAVDGATGPANDTTSALASTERACFLSHAQAIAAPVASAADGDALRLILEDDVDLALDLTAVLGSFGIEQLRAYDIVFLDCQPFSTTGTLMTLWNALQVHGIDAAEGRVAGANLYDAPDIHHWGATAYVVTPEGRIRIAALAEAALDAGPTEAYDMWLSRLAREGQLRAAVVAPFLVTPGRASRTSTMSDRPVVTQGRRVEAALRRLFFAGPWRDVAELARACGCVAGHTYSNDPRLDLLADLMAREFVAIAQRNARTGVAW